MGVDVLELPKIVRFLVQVQVVYNVVVCEYVLILVIVDGTFKASELRVILEFLVVSIDGFNESRAKFLSILLLVH